MKALRTILDFGEVDPRLGIKTEKTNGRHFMSVNDQLLDQLSESQSPFNLPQLSDRLSASTDLVNHIRTTQDIRGQQNLADELKYCEDILDKANKNMILKYTPQESAFDETLNEETKAVRRINAKLSHALRLLGDEVNKLSDQDLTITSDDPENTRKIFYALEVKIKRLEKILLSRIALKERKSQRSDNLRKQLNGDPITENSSDPVIRSELKQSIQLGLSKNTFKGNSYASTFLYPAVSRIHSLSERLNGLGPLHTTLWDSEVFGYKGEGKYKLGNYSFIFREDGRIMITTPLEGKIKISRNGKESYLKVDEHHLIEKGDQISIRHYNNPDQETTLRATSESQLSYKSSNRFISDKTFENSSGDLLINGVYPEKYTDPQQSLMVVKGLRDGLLTLLKRQDVDCSMFEGNNMSLDGYLIYCKGLVSKFHEILASDGEALENEVEEEYKSYAEVEFFKERPGLLKLLFELMGLNKALVRKFENHLAHTRIKSFSKISTNNIYLKKLPSELNFIASYFDTRR